MLNAQRRHIAPCKRPMRWMWLAMPDDVAQEIALAALLAPTPARLVAVARYRLRELSRTQWRRELREMAFPLIAARETA